MNRTRVIHAMKLIGMWLPALLLVAIFVPQGWAKFSDASGWATAFRHWGYPVWFRILIGVVELSAVACLLSGRWAALGAMMIITVMLGAMLTHLLFDHGRHLQSEVVPLTLAVIVLVIRRSQLRRMAEVFSFQPAAPARSMRRRWCSSLLPRRCDSSLRD